MSPRIRVPSSTVTIFFGGHKLSVQTVLSVKWNAYSGSVFIWAHKLFGDMSYHSAFSSVHWVKVSLVLAG